MPKPIKRSIALTPISREHHHGLLLSWKIKEGIKRNIEVNRIKKYTDWFWKNHLQQHFEFEEKYIFIILGEENPLIKQALKEHKRLHKLFANSVSVEKNLILIQKELTTHIRFEERILFPEIEKIATSNELLIIESSHSVNIKEEWKDEFWITK